MSSEKDYIVKDTYWFSGQNTVGIVLIETAYGHKAYIGVGRDGNTEHQDIESIAACGSRFYLAPSIWPDIKDWGV